MGPEPPRWRRRKEARPQEIVEAALAVFAERGFAATKLDEVARRAGVSKGTLYLYFPSKEELFKAVVREAVVPNLARVERMIASFDGPTPELLHQIVTVLSRILATTPLCAIPKLVLAESGNFPDIALFYLDEAIKRGLGLLRQVVERGITRGEFRPVDSEYATRVIVAPAVLLALWRASFERFEARPLDVDTHIRTHLDVVLNGMRGRP